MVCIHGLDRGIGLQPVRRRTHIHPRFPALLSCPLEDGYFYPVPEGGEADWSDPRLGDLGTFLQDVRNEQHAS